MKRILFYLLFVTAGSLVLSSCVKDRPEEPEEPFLTVNDNSSELSKRITYINEPLDIGGDSGGQKSTLNIDPIVPTPEMDCATGCTMVISNTYSGELKIKNGETVCITETGVFTGGLKMQGGTLSVCGTANVSYISTGNGTIVVNQTGTYSASSIYIDPQLTFAVYGTLDLPSSASMDVKGQFENHSTVSFASVSTSAQGVLYNAGNMSITNGLSINDRVENHGTLDIGGQLSLNNSASLINTCTLTIGANFTIDNTLINESYIEVGSNVYLNNNAEIEMKGGALFSCNKITVNGDIYNNDGDYAMIEATNQLAMNGGDVAGKIDLCCPNGVTDWGGSVGPQVSYCTAYIPPTECNPGHGEPLEPQFTLVANVPPIVLDGNNLSATSVQIIGDLAYVSYHLHGEPYGAAIEVFQLNENGQPVILQQLLSSNFDFNELKLDDATNGNTRKMWVMGSQKISSSEELISPAILAELTLESDLMVEPYIDLIVDLSGYSGNSVQKDGAALIAVTGSDGGITVLDYATKNLLDYTPLAFAKYLSVNGNNIISLTASETEATLYHYPQSAPDFSSPDFSEDIGSIEPRDGKSVVHLDNNRAYVACGEAGLKVYNASDLNGPVLSFNPEQGNSNGVDSDDDIVYLANGAGGLYLLNKSDLEVIGNYKFDGSANFVTAGGNDYIFLANGTGGLFIIHRDE